MSLTVSELGILFLLLFAVFHWLGVFAKIRAVLALLGLLIIGTGGWIGHILAASASWVQSVFGTVTAWAFGSALTAGPFIVLAVVLIHDLHPKRGASKRTGFVAVAVAALLVAGVAGIPALAGLRNAIDQGVSNAFTAAQGR